MSQSAELHARPFGFVEEFRIGDRERVETVLAGFAKAGASFLRTFVSWADGQTPEGQDWIDWLIPRLAQDIELLPCIGATPPALSRTGQSSGAPQRIEAYGEFIDQLLTRHGEHFTHVELWNEPDSLRAWDWRSDPSWQVFGEMIGKAADLIEKRGWKAVLGASSPLASDFLQQMGQCGVLNQVSAVALRGFPGTWDERSGSWVGWDAPIAEAQSILSRHQSLAEIWITQAGYSTWKSDDLEQARRFLETLHAPARRHYWLSWQDHRPSGKAERRAEADPARQHLGIVEADGSPKLLAQLLMNGGLAKVEAVAGLAKPYLGAPAKPVVIMGGAGFIGSNLADSYLKEGQDVLVVDNLSRPGVEINLQWLQDNHGAKVHTLLADLRAASVVEDALKDAGRVFHLAAQVAVTTSLDQPVHDFAINAQGTLNVLEAMRRSNNKAPVVFSSTNKVYGGLDDLEMRETGDRYVPGDNEIGAYGISEARGLDFCTPYGCSKGVADQYVLDYAKSFGLSSAVLRMSCIYGPRQFGTEDQGWVAHFLIRALKGEPITIYGNGKQVRDILHVSDAVAAYRAMSDNIETVKGKAFNLGGGPNNAVSLKMVLDEIGQAIGRDVELRYGDWRQGDQFYFVADTRKIEQTLGWQARMNWRDGLKDLASWLQAQQAGRAVHPAEQRVVA